MSPPLHLRLRHVHGNRPRHRHFVVLPLFLLLLAASVSPVFFPARSLTASVTHAGAVRDLGAGLVVRMEEGSILRFDGVPVLEEGSGLFTAAGIAQVRTPIGSVLGLAGAFHIVVHKTQVTVSAITAPVLVIVQGHVVLVPMGMQYLLAQEMSTGDAGTAEWVSVRKTPPLPAYFLKEQVLSLRDFPVTDWLPERAELPALQYADPTLQLPAAQERARATWRLAVLGALRSAVEQGQDAVVRYITQTEAFLPALSDPQSLSTLVALADQPEVPNSVRASLLRPLLPRHDLWLLAALHPRLRAGAWTFALPALSAEERMVLAFGVPAVDRQPDGFSPVVMAWWTDAVLQWTQEQQDPAAFVTVLLQTHLPLVEEYYALQYPERAQTLVRALMRFAAPLSQGLPADVRDALKRAEQRVTLSVVLFPASAASSVPSAQVSVAASSSTPALSIDPEERVARVVDTLERAQALFGLHTRIDALSDGRSVRVNGILFGSSQGDRECSFDVDVSTEEVSGIVFQGRRMPYPLTLPAFLEWVKK